MEHHLKTLHSYWLAVEREDKNFEVRHDDRGFQKGDVLVLNKMMEHDPTLYDMGGFSMAAKPKCLRRVIIYILTGGQLGIEPGYVVMGLAQENLTPPTEGE